MHLNDSESLAKSWLQAQNLGEDCYLKPASKKNKFLIRRKDKGGRVLQLMIIKVKKDRSVNILADYRKKLENENPHGLRNESRMFAAAAEKTSETPVWFKKFKRSPIALDIKGIDGFAVVTVNGKRLSIPVQIKSSLRRANEFLDNNPDFVGAVIVVRRSDSNPYLRAKLYEAARQMREKLLNGEYSCEEHKALVKKFCKRKRRK